MYLGYCQRSGQYRMMDLPDYMSNMQEGLSRWMTDSASAYQGMFRNYPGLAGGTATMPRGRTRGDCGCNDCHCECCVSDADMLVHARCGELRRIPVTFENDTRRERPVTLDLGKFLTSGGRDLGWTARLSETQFTLRACDEHSVLLLVQIRCETDKQTSAEPAQPAGSQPAGTLAANVLVDRTPPTAAANDRFGGVDRCEVGYATIRAEGCLTRPLVVAVAVLPDDCDAYHHPCGCDCCN
jgi:hypothetical protein